MKLHPDLIRTCFLRAAKGLVWVLGQSGGPDPYLCDADEDELYDYLEEAANDRRPRTALEAADEAFELKRTRLISGVHFLTTLRCLELADHLSCIEVQPPSRKWVARFIQRKGLCLKARRTIDIQRLDGCGRDAIAEFFAQFGSLIRRCSPELLFGCDETMLECSGKAKVLVPEGSQEGIFESNESFPHISAMMTHTASGEALPPFVIFPKLNDLPPDLAQFDSSGKIWFVSSPKGWQSRNSFLIWCFHFINWLSSYRKRLRSSIRHSRGLLISDGHSSRGCPAALQLLDGANIDLLIIPSHTSHVLQMFDLVLASPLKHYFTEMYIRMEREDLEVYSSIAARVRFHAMVSLLDAWSKAASYHNCVKSAEATGIYPFKPEIVLANRFVHELNEREHTRAMQRAERRKRRLDLNSKVLTLRENEDMIVYHLLQNKIPAYLQCIPHGVSYSAYVKAVLTQFQKETKLLSRIPPFSKSIQGVVYFD
jgi:hypothetical protein